MKNRIFSTDSPKAVKAGTYGWLNAIHYLAPADISGVDVCPMRSPACTALCLGWFSGQASMVVNSDDHATRNKVRQSRIDKTRRFMRDRAAYMGDVVRSIESLQRQAARKNLRLCVRMNGSSDIAWEGIRCERNGIACRNLFEAFPDVTFVDYTKIARRFERALPPNYHLTFSRSESNEAQCLQLLTAGHNVAVVFGDSEQPAHWFGFPVIDGDRHDLRHLDPKGCVVGLAPKGNKAKRDRSGFVLRKAA